MAQSDSCYTPAAAAARFALLALLRPSDDQMPARIAVWRGNPNDAPAVYGEKVGRQNRGVARNLAQVHFLPVVVHRPLFADYPQDCFPSLPQPDRDSGGL